MRHNQVIYLLSTEIVTDDLKNQIEQDTERRVFANEFSVSSNEYYNAAASGLKISKRFEIYSFEYKDEEKLKHDGVTYEIVRTEGKGEKIRLTCKR